LNKKSRIILRISKPGGRSKNLVLELPQEQNKKNIVARAYQKSKDLDQYMLRKIKGAHGKIKEAHSKAAKHVSKHMKKHAEKVRHHVRRIKHHMEKGMAVTKIKTHSCHPGMSAGMKDFLLGVLMGVILTAVFLVVF